MPEGSISRTLRVLGLVCEHGPETLKALSERTELPAPTLLRILRLMADEGYVVQEPDKRWRGTMLVWRLGCAVNAGTGIASISQEHTDRLTAELDETSVYAVFEQNSVIYASHAEPLKPVRAHVRLGDRYGLFATTTGQAILAYLDTAAVDLAIEEQRAAGEKLNRPAVAAMLAQVREVGYASGTGRRWAELWGCAAPVFDSIGRPVGALGVSIPTARADEIRDTVVAAVVREAADMSRHLGSSAHRRAR